MHNDRPAHPYAYELILTPGIPTDIASEIYLDPEQHPDYLKTKQANFPSLFVPPVVVKVKFVEEIDIALFIKVPKRFFSQISFP